jgi:hypothetical protein
MAEYVTLDQIAETIGVDVTTVRRTLKVIKSSLDIEVHMGRAQGRSRRALCVTVADGRLIEEHFKTRSEVTAFSVNSVSPVNFLSNGFGYFYVIQLIPEHAPERVKIGYTDNLDTRLKEHQTSAPTARLIRSWPCKRAWDYAAMDSITRIECHHVMNEVYEGNIAGFLARGDKFFGLMPTRENVIPLSPHSPLTRTREESS